MRNTLLASGALALAACATTVPDSADIQQAAEEIAPQAMTPPDAFAADAGAPAGPVDTDWLDDFNDPVLEALVAEAVANNLALRGAVARLDRAAAIAIQAGAELYPAVVVAGQGSDRQGFSSTDPALTSSGVALNVSWEVDIWGRVRAQAAAGEAAFEATAAQVAWAHQSVAAQTAKMYFFLTQAQLQQELVMDSIGLYARTLELVEAKYRIGQVTQREVALARAEVAGARATLRQAEAGKQQAARALEVLLSRYPSAEVEGAQDLPAPPPPVPVGMPSELLERRPDIVSAERAVAAEFLQIESAQAARLPAVNLTAGLGTTSNELENVIALGSDFWSVGGNFLAPIFTGGALEAAVEIQTAEQEEALANYGLTALQAFSEVETALANEALLREQEAFLREAVDQASEALRVAQAQFDIGRVDLLSVLQQQGQVIAAQVDLLTVRGQRLQQRIDLHLALGGGFEPPSE